MVGKIQKVQTIARQKINRKRVVKKKAEERDVGMQRNKKRESERKVTERRRKRVAK